MVKWFLLHGLFSVVEETLRAVQRASPSTIPVSGRFKSIAKVTEAVLNASDCQKFDQLFRLVRCTRNTIHTNGVFLPEDGRDVSVEYKGERFDFVVGRAMEFIDDQRAIWFVKEVTGAMLQIAKSDAVARIEYCPRTQPVGGR